MLRFDIKNRKLIKTTENNDIQTIGTFIEPSIWELHENILFTLIEYTEFPTDMIRNIKLGFLGDSDVSVSTLQSWFDTIVNTCKVSSNHRFDTLELVFTKLIKSKHDVMLYLQENSDPREVNQIYLNIMDTVKTIFFSHIKE